MSQVNAFIDVIGIDTLCPRSDADSFVPVIPAAAPAPPIPFNMLRQAGWRREAMPRQPMIGPLGLSRLTDVVLCGSGYLFSQGRFVLENAHTSRIALQWLQNEHFPDNPFTTPPQADVTPDRTALIIFGPGFPIWGHFMLDYLPRIVLAQRALGERFGDLVIPVPVDAPDWLFTALDYFCGIGRGQLFAYDRHRDRLHIHDAWLPSFAHGGEHVLHPFATALFRSFVPDGPPPSRRICLSRKRFETETRSLWRVFEGREVFEQLARRRGYEVVCPEDMTLSEQIALFADTSHLVGEFGSGMHNAVFSGAGTRVGCFPFNNALQTHIADAGSHVLSVVERQSSRTDARGVVFFDVSVDDLEQLFDRLDLGDERSGTGSSNTGNSDTR